MNPVVIMGNGWSINDYIHNKAITSIGINYIFLKHVPDIYVCLDPEPWLHKDFEYGALRRLADTDHFFLMVFMIWVDDISSVTGINSTRPP